MVIVRVIVRVVGRLGVKDGLYTIVVNPNLLYYVNIGSVNILLALT